MHAVVCRSRKEQEGQREGQREGEGERERKEEPEGREGVCNEPLTFASIVYLGLNRSEKVRIRPAADASVAVGTTRARPPYRTGCRTRRRLRVAQN